MVWLDGCACGRHTMQRCWLALSAAAANSQDSQPSQPLRTASWLSKRICRREQSGRATVLARQLSLACRRHLLFSRSRPVPLLGMRLVMTCGLAHPALRPHTTLARPPPTATPYGHPCKLASDSLEYGNQITSVPFFTVLSQSLGRGHDSLEYSNQTTSVPFYIVSSQSFSFGRGSGACSPGSATAIVNDDKSCTHTPANKDK